MKLIILIFFPPLVIPSFGAGVVFYPIPLIQFGATLGTTLNIDSSSSTEVTGFLWNISIAFDFGENNGGCLLGIKYSGSIIPFKDNYNFIHVNDHATIKTSYFGVFVKYAYRRKNTQQNTIGKVVTENKKSTQGQTGSNSGIDKAVGRASQRLINDLPEKSRLAIINVLSNSGDLSTQVVDELEYQLVFSKKFTIVNRNSLDTIRREQNFQMSGNVSDESVVSIGKILGASIVITGSITETGKNHRLIIRALDVKTAEIITMVREDY